MEDNTVLEELSAHHSFLHLIEAAEDAAKELRQVGKHFNLNYVASSVALMTEFLAIFGPSPFLRNPDEEHFIHFCVTKVLSILHS